MENKYFLPDKVYQVLKWIGLALLPALGIFTAAVGNAWALPHVDEIVATMDALGVLIAALIGYSQMTAGKD